MTTPTASISSVDHSPLERINQRRKQLHVHSVLYYHLGTSLIDDATFDRWAYELVHLHKAHPELVMEGYLPTYFADWDGSTGMHLPASPTILALADWLVEKSDADQDDETSTHDLKTRTEATGECKKFATYTGDFDRTREEHTCFHCHTFFDHVLVTARGVIVSHRCEQRVEIYGAKMGRCARAVHSVGQRCLADVWTPETDKTNYVQAYQRKVCETHGFFPCPVCGGK